MQNRTFDQLGSECVQDNDRRCGFVYLLSSVSPISAFGWEVFADGLAWGMGRKRIVWLRHARMLVCGEVFQGFSDGLSPRDGVRSPFFPCFRHADAFQCLQGFASCFVMPDLRGMGLCCRFISCCRSASGSPAGVPRGG